MPPLLPDAFSFGVATAGFQIEGGYNGPGEPANNWIQWERTGRVEPSGLACDFWDSPEEALDRAAGLGCDVFRLSIEWARLEPAPGIFDETALARYVEILTMCTDRGLEPVITLHHFTHPWWLGEEFWLTPGSPDQFVAYVARVLPALAPHCRRWITINEPNIVSLMGWIEGQYPPGRTRAFADAFCVLDNLLCAHVLVYDLIHAVQPHAHVTVNTSSSSIYEHDRLLTDLLVAPAHGIGADDLDDWIDERRAMHDAVFTPTNHGELWLRRFFGSISPYGNSAATGGLLLGSTVRNLLRRPAPRRAVQAVSASPSLCPLDAVGFDWYDPIASHAIRRPGHVSSGRRSWSLGREIWDVPANAHGLAGWCRDQSVLLPGMPLWIVENGMATKVQNGRAFARTDRWDRPRYLKAHVAAVVDAVAAGAPVTSYFHWSLMDNYEWGSYTPRLGLFGLDRSRGAKGVRWMDTDAAGYDSAGEYRRLIAAVRSGDERVLAGIDRRPDTSPN